ncbi:MAG: winged helix-turn-helix transcriptional regulator [Vallitaleaceae bacterium]|nr:winged helix-turn-helix transcriptional regulator [Vallitaleaceae bacterium]
MIHISNLKDGLPYFKALSSDVRINILELLTKHNQLNMQDIANELNLTSGTITMHIKKLTDCGLIEVSTLPGKQGIQKMCYLPKDKIIVDIGNETSENTYESEISVGHYSAYKATPTCGLATKERLIGEVDDSRYFADPERINAGIIWLTAGFLEYHIPNYLKADESFEELQITMELSSEAPGICNNWPSNIYFSINGVNVGFWVSPGDFGTTKGILTPSWWFPNWNQHGLLKLLSINSFGTFIDGLKISDTTLADLNLNYRSEIILRIEVPEDSEHVGGLTLFGRDFGNYGQGIHTRIIYHKQN